MDFTDVTTILTALVLMSLPAFAGGVEVASMDGANIQRPVWAPDGKTLAWEANFHDQQAIHLYLGDPVSRSYQKLGGAQGSLGSTLSGFQRTAQRGRVAQDITFSPASEARVIYTASTSGLDLDLHLEGWGTVATHRGADGGAAWSPDGRHVAFTSSRTGDGDIYLLDASKPGQPPVRISFHEDTSELYIDWSADSASLAYVAQGQDGDHIWLVSAEGGPPLQLTTWPGSQLHPKFSPHDNVIAFYANHTHGDRFDLYTVSTAPGSEPVKLAEDVLTNSSGPAWSPDGRHILFTARDDDAYNPICLVPASDPAGRITLPLNTVGHGDLAVTERPNRHISLAYVAQGLATDNSRTFKKLYVADLALPQ